MSSFQYDAPFNYVLERKSFIKKTPPKNDLH